MGHLNRIRGALLRIGYQIIAVSADKPEELEKSTEKLRLKYTLLSDSDMTGARALGLTYRVSDERYEFLKTKGIDIEEASGKDHHILPVPAVFVIGTDGVIKHQYVNPDHTVRMDPYVLLAAAKHAFPKKEEEGGPR